MKYSFLCSLKSTLTLTAALFLAAAPASAACPEPASGKLVICQPSPNSTVFQVPHFEAAANPPSGSITSMNVFIDNKLVFQNGGPDISLFQGGVANGKHTVMITAADSFGRSYQAQQSFSVTGNVPFSCPARRFRRTWSFPSASKATPPSVMCGPTSAAVPWLTFHRPSGSRTRLLLPSGRPPQDRKRLRS